MGPSWRADVWTVLESEQNLSTAELARRVGCSFATAWQVAQDFKLLYPEQSRPMKQTKNQPRIKNVLLTGMLEYVNS
jgi:hypothetical protein